MENEDNHSPKTVQSTLRNAGVRFSTVQSSGRWEVPSAYLLDLSQAFEGLSATWDPKCIERLTQLKQDRYVDKIVDARTSLSGHHLGFVSELGLEPYEEQEEAATLMSAPHVRRFALFWKPGTGKTGAMIAAAHELLSRGIVKGVLVVAERPIAMRSPWATELARWLPGSQAAGQVAVVMGSKRQRLTVLESNPKWVIVNYFTLSAYQYPLISWARRMEGAEGPIIIFDESDMIKNPGAQRSRAAMVIRQECGRCWIASGTPAPNSPSDYEHQLSVLSGYPVGLPLLGDRSHDALVVVHELEKGFHYLQRENPRKMPEVATPIQIDLSPPQRCEYDRLSRELLSELEGMDDRTYAREMTHVMSRRMRLLRVCSDPGHRSLPSPVFDTPCKLPKLDELLEAVLRAPDEKVVVWTRFRDTALMLCARYKELYGASLMIGGGEGTPADLTQPNCRLLVATIQVGASSIDLTAARNAIYESMDDVSRNFTQSMARINRTGQTRDCRYWFMTAKDTVEEDLFENTMAKMQVSEEVLEEIGQPGRSQMIELLKRTLGMSQFA